MDPPVVAVLSPDSRAECSLPTRCPDANQRMQTIIVGWDATVSGSRGLQLPWLQVNPETRSFLTGHRILSDCDKHSVRTAAAI